MIRRIATFALSATAAVLLMAMMGLTVADVVGRYLFNSPVPGAFEATEIMLALAIFAGLPLVTARGEHIQVRLLLDQLPGAAVWLLERLADTLVFLLLTGTAWLLYRRGEDLAAFGDSTILLGIPLAPVAFALSALTGLAALVAAVRAIRRLKGLT
ncbi:MAG: TRAP transporter small permease [Pseudomonadota bacterium]